MKKEEIGMGKLVEIQRIQIKLIGKFSLTFEAIPTEKGKKQPRLISWSYDGYNPEISFRDIPKLLLKKAYSLAGLIFNKF